MLHNQAQMVQQSQASQAAFALLTYPDSPVAVIDDGAIYGILMIPMAKWRYYVWGLSYLPRDQAYQVWLIKPDETRISGGVFRTVEEVGYVSFVIESPQFLGDCWCRVNR